jgi:DNA ligase D-like protein (predicted 3'-phosphoesterase)
MALEDYQRKRNFHRSPEPAGDPSAALQGGPRFFCVQKHLASHLHYDLRLEHDGVLLSWAVPKGPALDPTIKRLAMHVEDHPIEYGTFEGVIPEGYGAGIVMLWDSGTWEPEVPDVAAALKKGDLKFRLDGVKLKGSWALVRTRSVGERSWLLIKHRDHWSGPLDIAEFAPLSVKSAGDFADILADDNPSIWTSNPPSKGGDTGAMFRKIVERAMALRAAQTEADKSGTRNTKVTKATKTTAGGTTARKGAHARATKDTKRARSQAPGTAGAKHANGKIRVSRKTPRTSG